MNTNKIYKWFMEKYPDSNSAMGCSEPGYNDKPVILANWNNIPQKVYDSLESHGYSCEWEDEWLICDECYKAFRCSPNSYGWEMFGYIGDGFAVCGNCINWDSYLEEMENQPRKAVTCALFSEFKGEITSRYDLIRDEFENGFHSGQNDNPASILESLLKSDSTGRFLFVIDGQGQFDLEFSVYKKNDESRD